MQRISNWIGGGGDDNGGQFEKKKERGLKSKCLLIIPWKELFTRLNYRVVQKNSCMFESSRPLSAY